MPKIKTLEEHLKDLELTFKEKGYVFKGQAGPWQGCRTHLTVSCPQHGDWDTGTISRFKSGQGCPKCKASAASKSDLQHLEDILNTGKFPIGAKIYSKNAKGANWTALWFYVCPVCSLYSYELEYRSPVDEDENFIMYFVNNGCGETFNVVFSKADESDEEV